MAPPEMSLCDCYVENFEDAKQILYLNELDQFVKHQLKARCYIWYVDDFVILENSIPKLEEYKAKITDFLAEKLKLQLHPEKSKILSVSRSVEFLGMRLFPYHRLLKTKNIRKFNRKLAASYQEYSTGKLMYDPIYEFMEGWVAYAKNANTYHLRKRILNSFEERFSHEISSKEVNRGRPKRKE
ncbi:RNA-directed DNA polymerase [Candidatus Woesearchaeota archaeon]|nr:RNA-directed DNA polymerase [Candidatus Woesearchaeota archaeon]